MEDHRNELELYRRQVDDLTVRNLQLQQELTHAAKTARRSRLLATLIQRAYRSVGTGGGMDAVGGRFLEVLLDTLSVDLGALFKASDEGHSFVCLHSLGLPPSFVPKLRFSSFPAEFLYADSRTSLDPTAGPLRSALGVPFFLWGFDPPSGFALLLGNASADRPVHCPFEEGDRELVMGALGVFIDIAARRCAQETLIESEEKYRAFFDNAADCMFTLDLDGSFTDVNKATERFSGYPKDRLVGMNFRDYAAEKDHERIVEALGQILSTEEPLQNFPFEVRLENGRDRFFEVHVVPIKKGQRIVGFQGSARDVTDRKRAEKERGLLESRLQTAREMEAVAKLAGGIAHEFNNALHAITGNVELLELLLPDSDPVAECIEPMKISAERMVRLTGQLLAYARGGKYRPTWMPFGRLLEDTLAILQHSVPSTIRLERDLAADLAAVEVDSTQMQMVLANILTNAREAIDGVGRIRISAGNVVLDRETARRHPGLAAGLHVFVAIEDNGRGMDQKTLDGLFRPFFSTKFQGRGLGMAAVYGIVKNHQGWIGVESELGKGTSVRILLPALPERPGEEIPRGEFVRGEATILVVEDEEPLLTMTRRMLEQLGYRMIETRCGRDAVDLVRTYDGDIDLALLDILLPDMPGSRVYDAMKKFRPRMKVIVCSGYALDGAVQEILDAGADGFLQKPCSFRTLSAKLSALLDTP